LLFTKLQGQRRFLGTSDYLFDNPKMSHAVSELIFSFCAVGTDKEASMHRVTTAILAAGVLALCAGRVAAAPIETPIDISGLVNANIQTYTGGTNYPLGPTSITVGSIPFNVAGFAGGGTGIIQTPTGDSSFTISVGIANVTTVFALVNSAFGTSGDTVGSLVFTDSASHTFTDPLVEGANIRDHFNDGFNNSATGIFATACFPSSCVADRFDAYQITLPASFAGNTLVSIMFNGSNAGNPQGQPFLAALTAETPGTSAVPLPAALPLFATGLGALGLLGWRRKKKATARQVPFEVTISA
jgi:hypothetical protein